jgi:hypothetical protein
VGLIYLKFVNIFSGTQVRADMTCLLSLAFLSVLVLPHSLSIQPPIARDAHIEAKLLLVPFFVISAIGSWYGVLVFEFNVFDHHF